MTSSCQPQQFVISLDDLYHQFLPFEYCFFFYPRGLAEALLRAVQTYQHPYGADQFSAILDDLDMYLDRLDDHNALPWKVDEIIDRVERVVGEMDRAIFHCLNMHFGENEFNVIDAAPLVPQLALVVSIAFELPPPIRWDRLAPVPA